MRVVSTRQPVPDLKPELKSFVCIHTLLIIEARKSSLERRGAVFNKKQRQWQTLFKNKVLKGFLSSIMQ